MSPPSRSEPDFPDLPDPELAARFEPIETFSGGEGWSGLVRERGGAERRLVLKILEGAAFPREAALLASLDHERIPRVLEIGETADGRSFLLREFVPGVPLQERLPLGVEGARELAVQVLELLGYVHLRGILHLDLKPQNVLCVDAAAGPRYTLLDFGLGARALSRDEARGGTPFYAAPERLIGLPPDARSDLFSLGALVLVALRRSKAALPLRRYLERFPREDLLAILGVQASDLPAPFDTWLPRMVAVAPEKRFADAMEALEALAGRGSGRPSVRLLAPDPIALRAGDLTEVLGALKPEEDVRLDGEDPVVLRALALHVAERAGGVRAVTRADDAILVQRGGGGPVRITLRPLQAEDLVAHLRSVLGLDEVSARAAARVLLADGVGWSGVVRRLEALVAAGRIVPDGPRWSWPEALAGRLVAVADVGTDDPIEPTAEGLERAAMRGRVEGAFEAFRAAVAGGMPPVRERALRAGLARGLLRAGEPQRVLPLTHDLPIHRARALVDLGRIQEAEAILGAATARGDPDALVEPADVRRLAATIAFHRGRIEEAEKSFEEAVRAGEGACEDRVALGLVRAAAGERDAAIAELREVVSEVDASESPYLCAAALSNLATVERSCGLLEEAERHHLRALELWRRLGNVRHTATASLNLGVLAKDRGRLEKAMEYLRRARRLYEHVDDRAGAALAEADLGIVSLAAGDAASAARRLEEAGRQLEELGVDQAIGQVRAALHRARAALAEERERAHVKERVGVDDAKDMTESGARRGVSLEVFRTILAVNRRLAAEADLEAAMRYLLDAAVTLTGGRTGYLLVARADGPRLELRVGERGAHALAFSRSMVNRAMQQQRVLTAADALADRELTEMPSVRDLRSRSAVCVPFVTASGVEGALYVEHPGRSGAFGDVEKECLEVLADQAAIAVERKLHEERLAEELERSRRELTVVKRHLSRTAPRMLGESPPMRALRERIARLAASELPILVFGETGSGKELAARAVHEQSARAQGPFVSENVSAIPSELLESELFGHVRGSFTGAERDRPGLLELASGGTLFLDEIGDMPPGLQAKLLRALQERRVRRVGDDREREVDFRLVAATHQDLRRKIAEGTFREDLYYRLAGAELHVPPLRDRGEDILTIAEHVLAGLNRQHRRDVRLGDAARRALSAYSWPGNVRELQHVVARAFLLTEGEELDIRHLPAPGPAPDESSRPWPVLTLRQAEARTIRAALEAAGGDKTRAAKILGISRSALYEKLKRLGRGAG